MARVATTISKDPVLTAKVLPGAANSTLNTKRRKSENLRQALVALGLNAATTLALSFSLVSTYKTGAALGISHTRYWRRAILGASAARTFAVLKGVRAPEDVFLAALLQDIAVLAIDRVQPDFYGLPAEAMHRDLIAHEIVSLGADHAAVGAWLLRQWKLPESLCAAVEASHDPAERRRSRRPAWAGSSCVALGSECVELLLGPTPGDPAALAQQAETWLGIGAEALTTAMSTIVAEIPEVERLFDTAILDADVAASIIEQARELLTLRNFAGDRSDGVL